MLSCYIIACLFIIIMACVREENLGKGGGASHSQEVGGGGGGFGGAVAGALSHGDYGDLGKTGVLRVGIY